MQTIDGTPRARSAYIASSARRNSASAWAAGTSNQTGPGRNPNASSARFRSRARLQLRVFADVRAGAEELAVAEHVVEASDRRPELGGAHEGQREGRALARVGVGPLGGEQRARGVGRVLEQVVLARHL